MKSREAELAFLYLYFDLAILNTAILFMGWFSRSISVLFFNEISIYLLQGNLSCIFTYFVLTKTHLYLCTGFTTRVSIISKQTLIFLFVSAVIHFLIIPHYYSRKFLLEYTALFFTGKLLFYCSLYRYLQIKRQKGINTEHVLIVGLNDTSHVLRNTIESNLIMGYRFIGFVDDYRSYHPDLIGRPDHLDWLIEKHHIEMVFVTMSIFFREDRLQEYLNICNRKGIHLRFVTENQYLFKSRINKESLGSLVMINPQEIPLDKLVSRVYKRLFDLAFSTLSIILLFTWLFPILIILIKLSSKGPVFFVQKRTGINNQIFNCIKFRSMLVNEHADIKQATANDSRITRIGRFLRNTNLDELPQFFNVFLGQMSVVGPRPHMLKHTEEYSKLINYYLIRHYVKPGVTGWAQVSGYRGETNELWKMEKRVEYDMFYIKNWTFFWDIKIILRTIFPLRSYKVSMTDSAFPSQIVSITKSQRKRVRHEKMVTA